jgi:hypothetical protein
MTPEKLGPSKCEALSSNPSTTQTNKQNPLECPRGGGREERRNKVGKKGELRTLSLKIVQY